MAALHADFAKYTTRYAGLKVRLLADIARLQEAFALRYHAYLNEGAITPNETQRFIDAYDMNRTSLMFGVMDQTDRVVGCLRFAVQPPAQERVLDFASGPEFTVFPEAVKTLGPPDRPIASAARFAITPNHTHASEIALMLLMAQMIAGRAVGARWGIATVRGGHARVYGRLMRTKQIAPPRRMPNLNYDYELIAVDIDAAFDEAFAAFPADARAQFEAQSPFWAAEVLHALPQNLTPGVAR